MPNYRRARFPGGYSSLRWWYTGGEVLVNDKMHGLRTHQEAEHREVSRRVADHGLGKPLAWKQCGTAGCMG